MFPWQDSHSSEGPRYYCCLGTWLSVRGDCSVNMQSSRPKRSVNRQTISICLNCNVDLVKRTRKCNADEQCRGSQAWGYCTVGLARRCRRFPAFLRNGFHTASFGFRVVLQTPASSLVLVVAWTRSSRTCCSDPAGTHPTLVGFARDLGGTLGRRLPNIRWSTC